MKILLINTSVGFDSIMSKENTDRFIASIPPPTGLLYIARSLEDEGHKIKVIDIACEKNPMMEIKKSLNSCDAAGLNVFTMIRNDVEIIAKSIKNYDKNLPIILGGPHCSFHPQKALIDIPSGDIGVEGEGEIVIKDIVKGLNGYKKFETLPGVFYRKNGTIKKGKPAEIIKNIDELPFPSRHLVEKYNYGKLGKLDFYKQKTSAMITSRGCPFKCKFCTRHLTSHIFRMRSAENVLDELTEISQKYKSVFIADDNFLANERRVSKIFDELIKMGSPLEIYINGARVDSANIDLYKKMKKAGVKHIYYGIESGNQSVIDYYNKKITIEQIKKALNLANKMDFITLGYFIFGAPFEKYKEIKNTINFANSLPLDFAIFYPLVYARGSDLWEEAVNEGKINFDEEEYLIIASSTKGLANFTEDEIFSFCEKAFKKFYFRPSYILRQIIKSIKRKNFTILKYGAHQLF
ncbi:MAG: radical SAM protein [Thermoplasmatales archaeon]|nr:radical SAM protein [Thermoplasmatales archaeon]